MDNKIRVAVVGVGYLGKIHAKIYAGMENVDLVGVVDTDQDAAHSVAEEFGTRSFEDSRVLLDKVDAVSIVVPTYNFCITSSISRFSFGVSFFSFSST